MTRELDWKQNEVFCIFKTRRDFEEKYWYDLFICQKWINFEKLEGMAHKLGLPRPLQVWNIDAYKSINFVARDFCF